MAKLIEELAGSTKEVATLKEEVRKAEILLKDVQSQLSSKSQDLETTNGTIEDLKARNWHPGELGGIQRAREKQLAMDLNTARLLRRMQRTSWWTTPSRSIFGSTA